MIETCRGSTAGFLFACSFRGGTRYDVKRAYIKSAVKIVTDLLLFLGDEYTSMSLSNENSPERRRIYV
jgi:hypothetical protein